jgi:SNF2 family DNA or RNA helicase
MRDEFGELTGEEVKLDVRDSSKLDEAVEIIVATNDQCVVFCNFNEPLEELAFRLQVEGLRPEIINSTYKKEMANYETDFQQQKIDVLLLNSAMGEGLNLQKDADKWPGGARAGISLDRWWNNARNDQCIKRIHRPGSKEPIFFYRLFVEHSVDYWIEDLCEAKDREFNAIMDSNEIRPASYWKEYLEGKM